MRPEYSRRALLLGTAVLGSGLAACTGAEPDSPATPLLDQGAEGPLRWHLFPATEARGLLVHFHGDGAWEFNHPTEPFSLAGDDGMVAVAERHRLAVLVPRTPDGDSLTWWEQGEQHVAPVMELLAATRSRLGLEAQSTLWLTGYSGGAQFITQYLLPAHPELMTPTSSGGAVLFGGGGAPDEVPDPVQTDRFTMHWVTGQQDRGRDDEGYDALTDARAGERCYAGLGVPTSHEWPAGVGHDLDGRFGPALEARLGR